MPTVNIDFDNVLWSSERQTDKIWNLQRFTLTIPAGQTTSAAHSVVPTTVDGYSPKAAVNGVGTVYSNKWKVYYKVGTAWVAASPINGSAAIVGIGVSATSGGVSAYALSSTGADRTVECVCMYMPTTPYTTTGGANTYNSATLPVVPYNDSARPDIKWSTFDKQATIAGTSSTVYTSDGTARRLATIPHGMSTLPTVMFSASILFFSSNIMFDLGMYSDYITVWKDLTNIYVEYTPPAGTPNVGNAVVQVWWYNE